MALTDIRQILARPALARLAKIEWVAEEVAAAPPPAHVPSAHERPARGLPG